MPIGDVRADPRRGFADSRVYPHLSIASFGTHDLPTFTGWWRGRDVTVRHKLRVLSSQRAVRGPPRSARGRRGNCSRRSRASGFRCARGRADPHRRSPRVSWDVGVVDRPRQPRRRARDQRPTKHARDAGRIPQLDGAGRRLARGPRLPRGCSLQPRPPRRGGSTGRPHHGRFQGNLHPGGCAYRGCGRGLAPARAWLARGSLDAARPPSRFPTIGGSS